LHFSKKKKLFGDDLLCSHVVLKCPAAFQGGLRGTAMRQIRRKRKTKCATDQKECVQPDRDVKLAIENFLFLHSNLPLKVH
jgi:hypothetical protein